MFVLLFFMACQFFYGVTEDQVVLEFYRVSSYNKGIDNAIRSSMLVECYSEKDEEGYVFAGHGSGNYFYSGKHKFILTASHVVDMCDQVLVKTRWGNSITVKTVYNDVFDDVAILKPLEEFPVQKPIKMKVERRKPLIGQEIFFMGHPVELHYFLFHGMVSQESNTEYWLHSTAWAGTSGAVVFSSRGRIVGTVSGVKVVHDPILNVPRIFEDMVLISKADFLSKKFINEVMDGK